MKKIVVIGSLNMDVVLETPRMPQIGEAIAFGQKVAAIVVTRKGAQTSIPTMGEVEE